MNHYEQTGIERQRLPGRTERRGAQTGFPTWGAFIFGDIFVTVGIAIILVGLKVFPVVSASVHAPYWVLTVFGVVFVLAGLLVWGMAWKQYRSNRRRLEAARIHPGKPAFADYNWDPRGFKAPRWKRVVPSLGGAVFLSLFLTIFNYWAFAAHGPWLVKVIVSIFDLFLLAVWWEACVRIGRALKFGGSSIAFDQFPYRLGAPMVVRWIPAEGIGGGGKGTFTLRCVEEWFEATGSGDGQSQSLVQEQIWRGTWSLDPTPPFHQGHPLEFRFEPPNGTLPTNLSGVRPVFWEFEVKLALPGLDFEELYLAPVY